MIKNVVHNAPGFWASYFINGDSSGLSDEEKQLADSWLDFIGLGTPVTCESAGFTAWIAPNGKAVMGDCEAYTFHENIAEKPRNRVERFKFSIPFMGFYETIWADDSFESDSDYYANERQYEESIPQELRLDDSTFYDLLIKHCDYWAARVSIAKNYVEQFNCYLEEQGINATLEFAGLYSPKEYNFQSDEIDVYTDRAGLAAILKAARRNDCLADLVIERHSSRDGFCSFYSNDLTEWLKKLVSQWDSVELSTLLLAAINCDNWHYQELNFYYDMSINESYSNAVDWQAFDNDVQAARDALVQDLLALNPDYVVPNPRCPNTLDMFDGESSHV